MGGMTTHFEQKMNELKSKRDRTGRFVRAANSLHSATIGLRLSRAGYAAFMDLARLRGIAPAVLARAIIEDQVNQLSMEGDRDVDY